MKMIFCLSRRKIFLLLICLSLFLLVFTVLSHQKSSAHDYLMPREMLEIGNSWRLVAHDVDEDGGQNFQLKPVTAQKNPESIPPQAAPPAKSQIDLGRFIPKHRVVHLDLKGAPPKMSYLKKIIPHLKEAGATALLVEYEDMFPYWGPLGNISAKNAYSIQDVKSLISSARQNDMIVIPLIQTFGHLEFVLKLDEFKHLRESSPYPQSICPSKDESWKLLKQMIDQVLSLHPDSEWVHIGCDEVYQIGQCPICTEKISKSFKDSTQDMMTNIDSKILFLDHVKKVANYVRVNKKKIPIIWDDMLRNIPENILQSSHIGSMVEPMVWVYVEDIDRFVDPIVWSTYATVFSKVWTASAFKGAFGERMFSVNVQRHAANQLSWLHVMKREASRSENQLSFQGIVLTGWSRYDHFAVLCELLPAGFPSLILSLAIISQGAHDFESVRKTHRVLQCNARSPLLTPDELRRNPYQWDLHRCKFPGSNFYGLLTSYRMVLREVEMASDRINNNEGWMTEYNVRHKFSSPFRVQESMRTLTYLPSSLKSLETQIEKALSVFYDSYTVQEWIEQHIAPLIKTIDDLNKNAAILTSVSSWPRRPLDESDD